MEKVVFGVGKVTIVWKPSQVDECTLLFNRNDANSLLLGTEKNVNL